MSKFWALMNACVQTLAIQPGSLKLEFIKHSFSCVSSISVCVLSDNEVVGTEESWTLSVTFLHQDASSLLSANCVCIGTIKNSVLHKLLYCANGTLAVEAAFLVRQN